MKKLEPGKDGKYYGDKFNSLLTDAIQRKDVIFLDLCHDSSDILKQMIKMDDKGYVQLLTCTFLPITDKKVNPRYLEFLISNAVNRIKEKDLNGSTLTEESKVKDVILKKVSGCIGQIINPERKIKSISPYAKDGSILSLETMTEEVWNLLQPLLERKEEKVKNLYYGLPINPDLIPKQNNVKIPHITIVKPGQELGNLELGSEYIISLGSTITNGKIKILDVQTTPLYPNAHITYWIDPGHKSVEGLTLKQKNNIPFQSTGIQINNYLVPL